MNPIDIAKLISEDINVNNGLILEYRFKDIRELLNNQKRFGLVDRYGIPLFPTDVDDAYLTRLVSELNIFFRGKFNEAQNLEQLAEVLKDMKKYHISGPSGQGHSPGRLEADRYHGRHKIPLR